MKIVFYGTIREKTKTKSIVIEEKLQTSLQLKDWLKSKYPDIEKYAYKIAVNNHIIDKNQDIKSTDLISIIPPFIGG